MNENKYCPLLSAAAGDIFVCCQGEQCAWYTPYDRCALTDIAMNTGDIQGVADMIDAVQGGQR